MVLMLLAAAPTVAVVVGLVCYTGSLCFSPGSDGPSAPVTVSRGRDQLQKDRATTVDKV